MDLSFEAAEKYFWTWLDFWRLGPRCFSKKVEESPVSYLSPVQFFLATLVILAAIWTVAYTTLQDFPKDVAAAKHFPTSTGDPKTEILRRALTLVAIMIMGSLPQRLVLWWPLKSPAGIRELLIAKFYASSAVLIVFASVDALLILPLFWIAQKLSDQGALVLVACWALGELVLFTIVGGYYEISTICAFARLRRRRFLEGGFAHSLVVGSLFSIGLSIVLVILGITERSSGAFVDGLDLLLAAWLLTPAAMLVWFIRCRLPRLKQLVASEYVTYG
jgi:hypothetical protein